MGLFVVTYPENGWDCVGSIYEADSDEQVLEFIAKERGVNVEDLEDTVFVHEKYEIIKLT